MRIIDADAFERAVMFSDDEDIQDVIYRLRDFPTIEQPHWIPCSERLPEDVEIGEKYPTVIFRTKDAVYAGSYEHYKWWDTEGYYVVNNVIAWMPSPKYIEESEEC